jgi:hypothetical protein
MVLFTRISILVGNQSKRSDNQELFRFIQLIFMQDLGNKWVPC